MAHPAPTPAVSYRLKRTFAHPPEKIFEAWTQAAALSRWFAPTDEYLAVVMALDVRPGGAYRIEMRHSGGNVHTVSGTYVEVVRPSRLSFLWRWEDNPAWGESLVTVDFRPVAAGCEMELVHDRFPDVPTMEAHEKGWTGCLGRLERLLGA